MKKEFLILIILPLGLSSCTTVLHRSEQSGYATGVESSLHSAQDFYQERSQAQWLQTQTELGIPSNRRLTDHEVRAIRTRMELNRLEGQLSHRAERNQYYSYKPYFQNDHQRIQFLRIPTREGRERFAQAYGLGTQETEFDRETIRLIENKDIARGMSRNAVKQSWGEPDRREYAGNPIYGNEAWRYNTQVSTPDGYKQEVRYVIFEAGRVAGWETH